MALQYLLLACLAAAVSAQSGTPDPGLMPEDPTTLAQQNLTIEERYSRMESVMVRDEHFFCPEQGGDFVDDVVNNDGTHIVNDWTLFLQYPVLAYLDSVKKQALVGQIVSLINTGSNALISTDDICIGRVYHYDVSRYSESVLINFYLRPNGTADMNGVTIPQINNAFRDGVNTAAANENDDRIRIYLDRQAIGLSNNTYGMIQDNVHPGSFIIDGETRMRFPVNEDPVLNAIILGSWPRQYSLEDFATNEEINGTASANLAGNPDPINQGLTGGDIVFIVIATFLCVLLAFLMVFGFCIQPFLM